MEYRAKIYLYNMVDQEAAKANTSIHLCDTYRHSLLFPKLNVF